MKEAIAMFDLLCPVVETLPFDALRLTEPSEDAIPADDAAWVDGVMSWSENLRMAADDDVEDDGFLDDDDDDLDDDDDDFLDDDDEYFDDDDDELFDDDDDEDFDDDEAED